MLQDDFGEIIYAQTRIQSPIVADFSEISFNPFNHAYPESTTLKLSSDDFGEIIYSQTYPRMISEKSSDLNTPG